MTDVRQPRKLCTVPVKKPTVPYARFNTLADAEQYFLGLGASAESLAKTSA
jgi:hypothetical protein